MTVQNSIYNFTFLSRAALPGLTGDVMVAITLATFQAFVISEPSVSHLHKHRDRFSIHVFLQKNQIKSLLFPSDATHRPILVVLVRTSALADWNAFVSTEDETSVTDAPFHTGMVA